MIYRLKIILQYFLTVRWLTKFVGWGAELCGGWLTHVIILLFVYIYKVNIQEAQQPDITKYSTFNEFFIRLLRNDARPIDTNPSLLVMPVDGIISQFGYIKGNSLFQAKGHYYSLEALLAGNKGMIEQFRNGSYTTIYLSPRDYHRVHMPCNGILREMMYIPGKLFSVNMFAVDNIPNLFARNKRIVCLFDTKFGPIALILVGAVIVGSIETVWAGTITSSRSVMIKHWYYSKENTANSVLLLKGEEMGLFKLGSTVIVLFNASNILLDDCLCINHITRVGQRLAYGIASINT
ncbi:archaetidylserine decarboxylase [Candidatus Hoaglandella endobia]|uniref:Phosphatidylserine decarboxylase proenzyme n=1 Tax=Candidatus Hoaglandella endobia TaxID=1778263 RepID=A0A143WUB8_9ENTR|nr:archaetidylserine decarboxylase [Candidatus Hoaglandella endobia]CUX97461.1 Phosphatidylserine decarboxylase proenzyme [Candidatus Hoaglandella endobia]